MQKEYFNIFIIATIGRPSLKEAINSCLNQRRETLVVVVFDDEEIIRIVDNPNVIYLNLFSFSSDFFFIKINVFVFNV